MFNIHDINRDAFMLNGSFARKGYDWWWHNFTAVNDETGEEKQFFIEFFTCNPALGGDDPVLGQLPENKENGIRPSYLMIKAGWWGEDHTQLHHFIGWNHVKIAKGAPYRIEAEDFLASETELKGKMEVKGSSEHPEWMCDDGEMEWNLSIEKIDTFHVGYGADHLFRDLKAFEMYWHAEGMKSFYSGRIKANGISYTVIPERSYGYADKNWGCDFTSPWVWLSSSDLTSRVSGRKLTDSVFDIGGGRPKAFHVALDRKLLGVMKYEGREFEYNFSKFWDDVKTVFESHETDEAIVWHVEQENRETVMITDVTCKKKDMLLVNYEAPDGSKKHNRLWNGGNGQGIVRLYEKQGEERILIDEIDAGHIGCEYGEYDS